MIQIIPLKHKFRSLKGVKNALCHDDMRYAVVFKEVKANGRLLYEIIHIDDVYSKCENLIRQLKPSLHKIKKLRKSDSLKLIIVSNRG